MASRRWNEEEEEMERRRRRCELTDGEGRREIDQTASSSCLLKSAVEIEGASVL